MVTSLPQEPHWILVQGEESVIVTLRAVHGLLVTQTCFKGQVSGSYVVDQKGLGLEVQHSSRVLWLACWWQSWVLSQHHDKGKKKNVV